MKRKGFTLLELIVATTIFTIVIAAAYSLFDSARSVTSRAELRAQLFQSARAALQAIEEDLRGAVMVASPHAHRPGVRGHQRRFGKGAVGPPGVRLGEPPHRVAYDINVVDVVRGGDVSKVYYWIEQDETRKVHGLVRERPKELLPPGGAVRREEDVVEVAQDVVHVNFRFYDAGEWRDTWDSSQVRRLPKAVEVTVDRPRRVARREGPGALHGRFYSRLRRKRRRGPNDAIQIESDPAGRGRLAHRPLADGHSDSSDVRLPGRHAGGVRRLQRLCGRPQGGPARLERHRSGMRDRAERYPEMAGLTDTTWADNPVYYYEYPLGDGAFTLFRPTYDDTQKVLWGMDDEASKINLNTAPRKSCFGCRG
jgi:general secretion pathway protein J